MTNPSQDAPTHTDGQQGPTEVAAREEEDASAEVWEQGHWRDAKMLFVACGVQGYVHTERHP